MKHRNDNGMKVARARVTFEQLPKGVQRADRMKQIHVMYRMLKKVCNVAGIFREMKEREHYVKPGEKRRKAKRLAKAIARGEVKEKKDKEQDREPRPFDEYTY